MLHCHTEMGGQVPVMLPVTVALLVIPAGNARQREACREQVPIGGRGNFRTVRLTVLYPLAASGLPFVAKATSLTQIPFTSFPVYCVTPPLI